MVNMITRIMRFSFIYQKNNGLFDCFTILESLYCQSFWLARAGTFCYNGVRVKRKGG